MSFENLPKTTADLAQEQVAKLRTLFPECVTETEQGLAVDFDLLRRTLSSEAVVEGPKERYRLEWPDKRAARYAANAPTASTLRPVRERSKDFDSTRNLYIEGDNLEALKLLRTAYAGKVKLIYIDPPYNTGKDFIYHDKYVRSVREEMIKAGLLDDEGRQTEDKDPFRKNDETEGRYHSDWLTMMYSRLLLARDLLTDDGVIFIHIDENEGANLERLVREIFGAECLLGAIVWDKRNPKGAVWGIAQQHELVIACCKNKEAFVAADYLYVEKKNASRMMRAVKKLIREHGGIVDDEVRDAYRTWIKKHDGELSGGEAAYQFIDDEGEIYQPVSMAAPDKPETRSHEPLIHPVTGLPCPVPAKGWRNPPATMRRLLEEGKILFGEDETVQPRRKYLLKENMMEPLSSVFYYGGQGDACGLPFDNPKPLEVAKLFVSATTGKFKDAIVLDFFSGSATTAHAVMQLNAEDGGTRRFIMVQLPDAAEMPKAALEAGFQNICDIGEERIRRAGEEILGEHPELRGKLDVGFRVLRLDEKNERETTQTPEELSLNWDTALQEETIKEGRTEEDLLFQALLRVAEPLLVESIEREEVAGLSVWSADDGLLLACLAGEGQLTSAKAEAVTRWIVKQDIRPSYVVFREEGFADDTVKLNVEAMLRQAGCQATLWVL